MGQHIKQTIYLKHVSAVVFLNTTTPYQRSVMLHIQFMSHWAFIYVTYVTLSFYFSFGK